EVTTKPNKPESVEVVSKSTTSLSVNFKAPTVNTDIDRYEVYQDGDDAKLNCLFTSGTEFTCPVDNLKAGTMYSFKVKAC
uniref:Fibronectin type-III domain-containing protein n=2 Tax=Mesocestoides corti TaxID=53468 RepID=A0A5K3FSL6_MESCO